MSADLKPYPAMKDSGVEWLGDVPKHWTTERFKSSMHNIVEQTTERRGTGLYVALEHVESWTGRLRHAGLDVSFDSQVKCFRSGDVLFGKLRPYLAKVTRPTSDGICVGEFLVLRPRHSNATAPYMEQQLRSKPIIDAVNSSTFGAKMPRADWQFMGGMSIALPPLPEQAAIVRFLDHADRRIRRYLRAKQQLITLLEEQKQAIIQQAVTGQIDIRTGKPYQAYKPSGVEWLGDVPEHWEVGPLKRFAARRLGAIKAGPFGSQLTAAEMTDADFKVYTQRNVIDRDLEKGFNYISNAKFHALRAFEVFPGDVLVTSRGTIGRTALVTEDHERGVLHPCLLRVQLDYGHLVPEFLMALLQDSQLLPRQLTFLSNATTIDVIYSSTLANIIVPVPPLDEQQAILKDVSARTTSVTSAEFQTLKELALLREYRTRLIADVVTGKLDVREAAARLPDEVEELEPLDEADALIGGEEEPTDALATAT